MVIALLFIMILYHYMALLSTAIHLWITSTLYLPRNETCPATRVANKKRAPGSFHNSYKFRLLLKSTPRVLRQIWVSSQSDQFSI